MIAANGTAKPRNIEPELPRNVFAGGRLKGRNPAITAPKTLCFSMKEAIINDPPASPSRPSIIFTALIMATIQKGVKKRPTFPVENPKILISCGSRKNVATITINT